MPFIRGVVYQAHCVLPLSIEANPAMAGEDILLLRFDQGFGERKSDVPGQGVATTARPIQVHGVQTHASSLCDEHRYQTLCIGDADVDVRECGDVRLP